MIAIIETLLDEQEVSVLYENNSIQQQLKLVKAYPNPFNSSISINFNIFNLMSVLIMIKYQTFLIRSGLLNCREIQNKKYRIEKLIL